MSTPLTLCLFDSLTNFSVSFTLLILDLGHRTEVSETRIRNPTKCVCFHGLKDYVVRLKLKIKRKGNRIRLFLSYCKDVPEEGFGIPHVSCMFTILLFNLVNGLLSNFCIV